MLKKTITYVDFLGNTRTEDKYFNFSKSELSDMQMSVDGGFDARLNKMLAADDKRDVYNTFVKIVLDAYGEVSDDGRYFIKKDENGHRLADKFRQSPAYDVLMDEICASEATIAEFCNAIMPKEMQEQNAAGGKFVPQDHKRPEGQLKAFDPGQNK